MNDHAHTAMQPAQIARIETYAMSGARMTNGAPASRATQLGFKPPVRRARPRFATMLVPDLRMHEVVDATPAGKYKSLGRVSLSPPSSEPAERLCDDLIAELYADFERAMLMQGARWFGLPDQP